MAHDALGSTAGPVVSAAPQTAAPSIMREPDGSPSTTEDLERYRIPGTPLTVIPLEKAGANESITLFGIRLPYRAVRLTNQNEITPAPRHPAVLAGRAESVQAHAWHQEDALNGCAFFTGHGVSDVVGLEPAPPGQPAATIPRFSMTARTDGFALDITDRIPLELRPDVVAGDTSRRRHRRGQCEASLDRQRVNRVSRSRIPGPARCRSTTSIRRTTRRQRRSTSRSAAKPCGRSPRANRETAWTSARSARIRAQRIRHRRRKERGERLHRSHPRGRGARALGMDRDQAKAARDEIVSLVQQKNRVAQSSSPRSATCSICCPRSAARAPCRRRFSRCCRNTPSQARSRSWFNMQPKTSSPSCSAPGSRCRAPIFFGAPIGYGYFRAPTTRYLRAPFEGSGIGSPFPSTFATIGPTLIPKGVITDFTTPAGGGTIARDWESLALS